MSTLNQEQSTEPMSRVEIDTAALERNVATVRRLVGPDTTVCGVVKKNAYGLGAVTIAHKLTKAGCEMLAVFSPEEAEQLNSGAVTTPMLLFYPLRHLARTDGLYRPAVAERLHLTIHDPEQLEALDQLGRTFGIKLPVHLYVDTGMSRSGLSPELFAEILESQKSRHYTRIAGVMSHLATASGDPKRAQKQLDTFDKLLKQHEADIPEDALVHLANSYGVLRSPTYHRTLVRPGLGLYGYGEHDLVGEPSIEPGLRWSPTVRWVSRVVQLGTYPRHAKVGYGATYTLKRKSILGLVPVGYGDGYPLALSSTKDRCAKVRVRHGGVWHECDVLGRVNMDQLTIDLTDLAKSLDDEADEQTLRGAEVEVYSNDPEAANALHKLAEMANSQCYELLCRLGAHLPRVYV
ncbi:alanine racemase [Algisphaera agarilytica]|uniref:Alanine racemase n=1 Tax=Algisphaera agarilytica TaxID=1385975 RepID=A0A7X0LKH3_9BACT|nr:alanine racemase [Algisphaera agarilytica]MBB6430425.1 alanine racemase [Algisphaera agarilytica]